MGLVSSAEKEMYTVTVAVHILHYYIYTKYIDIIRLFSAELECYLLKCLIQMLQRYLVCKLNKTRIESKTQYMAGLDVISCS